MTSVYVDLYIDDRPTTDLASWKISNGHISATGRPIHFEFGSKVGVSWFVGGFRDRWIERHYFRLEDQDGRWPCVVLDGNQAVPVLDQREPMLHRLRLMTRTHVLPLYFALGGYITFDA